MDRMDAIDCSVKRENERILDAEEADQRTQVISCYSCCARGSVEIAIGRASRNSWNWWFLQWAMIFDLEVQEFARWKMRMTERRLTSEVDDESSIDWKYFYHMQK